MYMYFVFTRLASRGFACVCVRFSYVVCVYSILVWTVYNSILLVNILAFKVMMILMHSAVIVVTRGYVCFYQLKAGV